MSRSGGAAVLSQRHAPPTTTWTLTSLINCSGTPNFRGTDPQRETHRVERDWGIGTRGRAERPHLCQSGYPLSFPPASFGAAEGTQRNRNEGERQAERAMPPLLLVKPKLGMINDRERQNAASNNKLFPRNAGEYKKKYIRKRELSFFASTLQTG
ncbi:hypothetical protein KM043_009630 [Ampulex compressa]|nr:hypothetical protein KM043_009630 [Ampulex compressa]